MYDGTGGLSQIVQTNGDPTRDEKGEAAEQNTHTIGYDSPFVVVCSGRGGAAGSNAYYLYKPLLFSAETKVMPKNLDLRSLSVESFKSLNAGKSSTGGGGASWFADGPAVNKTINSSGETHWGCGAAGHSSTGDGFTGGSGVVQIFY